MHRKISIFEELKWLQQELEQERRLRKQWQERCYKLEKEVKELRALLNRFINANTPSSKLPFSFKNINRELKGTNPRGKPEGSNGGTREEPEKIDKKIDVKAKQCPNGHRNIEQTDCHVRFVYEIGEIRLIAKQFTVGEYDCAKCGIHFDAAHPELPKVGIFGPNLQSLITEIRHNFAGS